MISKLLFYNTICNEIQEAVLRGAPLYTTIKDTATFQAYSIEFSPSDYSI